MVQIYGDELQNLVNTASGRRKAHVESQIIPVMMQTPGTNMALEYLQHVANTTVPVVLSSGVLQNIDSDEMDGLMMGVPMLPNRSGQVVRQWKGLYILQVYQYSPLSDKDKAELAKTTQHNGIGMLAVSSYVARKGVIIHSTISNVIVTDVTEINEPRYVVNFPTGTNKDLAKAIMDEVATMDSMVIRYLCFREFVEIKEINAQPGKKVDVHRDEKVRNATKLNIKVLDCTYFHRILIDRTTVRGHWRWQVCGPKNTEHKYIFIEPHERPAHIRKAGKES